MRRGLLLAGLAGKAGRFGFVIEEVFLSPGAAVAETMEMLPCKVLLRTRPLVRSSMWFRAWSGRTGFRCHDHGRGSVRGPSVPAAAAETIDVVPCSPPLGAGASYYRGLGFVSVASLGKLRARSICP